jgi:hypothetical protein
MATHSTVWSGILSVAASSLAAGYAIVKNGNTYLPATTANRAMYGRSVGISLSAASAANGSFEFQVAGVMSASLTGLGAGTASWVRASATGTLERCTPASGDDIVGKCNTAGDLTIVLGTWDDSNTVGGGSTAVADDIARSGGAGTDIDRVEGIHGRPITSTAPGRGDVPGVWNEDAGEFRPGKPVMPDHFSVVDYGAVGDGVTDDLPAFEAAIAAMGVAPTPGPGYTTESWKGKTLFIPAGVFRLSGPLIINRQMIVKGVSGGGDFAESILLIDKGYTGIHVAGVLQATGGGGRGDFALIKDVALYHDVYSNNMTAFPVWEATTAYAVGDIIVPSVVTHAGYALRCTVAGTSGSTEPAWPVEVTALASSYPTAGDTYADGPGLLEWEILYAHGIEIRAQFVRLSNVQFRGFPSNGIDNVASYLLSSLASLTNVEHCRCDYNGGHGIMFAGDDSNAGLVSRCDFSNNRGFGIHGRAFLNMTYSAIHTAGNHGGAPYYATTGTFIECYAEGDQGAICLPANSVTWIGGVPGAGVYDDFSDRYRTPWSAGATIAAHGVRAPTVDNGWYYKSTAGGTTDPGVEPTWPIGKGKTVVDGTVTWICYGLTETTVATIVGYHGRNVRVESNRNADRLVSRVGSTGALANYAFSWAHLNASTDAEEHGYAIEYSGGDWYYYDTQDAFYAAYMTTSVGAFSQYGGGVFVFGNRGCVMSGSTGRARVLAGTAAEPSGVAADFVFNSAPTAGAPLGWRCLTTGTPGTWETILHPRAPAVAMAALAIDCATGRVFTKTLAMGANAVTLSNMASGDIVHARLTSDAGGSTVSWDASIMWPAGGAAPTQSTPSKTDLYTFIHDGTNVYGSVVQDFS